MIADHLTGETHDENWKLDNHNRIHHLAGGLDYRDRVLRILEHKNHQLGSHVSQHGGRSLARFNLTQSRSWTCKHQDPAYDYKNIDFSVVCSKMVSNRHLTPGLVLTKTTALRVLGRCCARRARGSQSGYLRGLVVRNATVAWLLWKVARRRIISEDELDAEYSRIQLEAPNGSILHLQNTPKVLDSTCRFKSTDQKVARTPASLTSALSSHRRPRETSAKLD